MISKPQDVRLARHGDEELLFALIRASDDEWSMGARDDDKVRGVIGNACNASAPPRPMFGVIQGPLIIEGAIGLFPTEPWNSSDLYLRAFFHFVHPLHRQSKHAVHLVHFAQWFGERAGLRVVFELLHPERTAGKARFYSRHARPIGGLYVHDVTLAAEEKAA